MCALRAVFAVVLAISSVHAFAAEASAGANDRRATAEASARHDMKPELRFSQSSFRKSNAELRLKAINVASAKLRLFRINGHDAVSGVWPQYAKAELAPSENLYFASNNGQQVWQGEVVFGDKKNSVQSADLPLPKPEALSEGIYFLAAQPSGSDKDFGPEVMAGTWFSVYPPEITALKTSEGLLAFVTSSRDGSIVVGADTRLISRDGSIEAEAKTDASGMALLRPEGGTWKEGAAVVAMAGEAVGLRPAPEGMAFAKKRKSGNEAFIALDRGADKIYGGGETVVAILAARADDGEITIPENTKVKMLRPDGVAYDEASPKRDFKGIAYAALRLPANAASGTWKLAWTSESGEEIAVAPFRVGFKGKWPRLSLTSEEPIVSEDGAVAFLAKAVSEDGKPLANVSGKISWKVGRPAPPDRKEYVFGVGEPENGEIASGEEKFVTSSSGAARVKLNVPARVGSAIVVTAKFDGIFETATAAIPVVLSDRPLLGSRLLPSRSADMPSMPDEAAIELIAVDAAGKRKSYGGASFQIYEEDRSFEWHQADGRWTYSLLPRHRSVGKGKISVSAAGENVIRWPLAAGRHALEVSDSEGRVVLRQALDIGRKISSVESERSPTPEKISLRAGDVPLETGKQGKVAVILSKPAFVSLAIDDGGKTRFALGKWMDKGENLVAFTPDENWRRGLRIVAEANFSKTGGGYAAAETSARLKRWPDDLTISSLLPAQADSGKRIDLQAVLSGNSRQAQVAAVAAFSSDDEGKMAGSSAVAGTAKSDEGGRASLSLDVPDFSGAANVVAAAWEGKRIAFKSGTVKMRRDFEVSGEVAPRLGAGKAAAVKLVFANNSLPDGTYAYEISSSDFIKVTGAAKGALTLRRGKTGTVSLSLSAAGKGLGELRVAVTGQNGFQTARTWPVAVGSGLGSFEMAITSEIKAGGTATFPIVEGKNEGGAKSKNKDTQATPKNYAVLIAPFPLLDSAAVLPQILTSAPTDTATLWQTSLSLTAWREVISSLNLAADSHISSLVEELSRAAMARQNLDGGFASVAGDASDMNATAFSLLAMQDGGGGDWFNPADKNLAVAWLRRRLDNTWFDESERPARALGFLALATAGQADISAIRYFADTSLEKEIGADTAAAIALALHRAKDDDMSKTWVGRARSGLRVLAVRGDAEAARRMALAFRLLAENGLLSRQDIISDIGGFSAATPSGIMAKADVARGVMALAKRGGTWKTSLDGGEESKREGVFAFAVKGRSAPVAVKNQTERQLFATQSEIIRQ